MFREEEDWEDGCGVRRVEQLDDCWEVLSGREMVVCKFLTVKE